MPVCPNFFAYTSVPLCSVPFPSSFLVHSAVNLSSWGLRVSFGHQLANDQVLLVESLLPALQIVQLVIGQTVQIIQRSLEVLRQHVFVEALAGQAARGIPASKVLVWSALESAKLVSRMSRSYGSVGRWDMCRGAPRAAQRPQASEEAD